MKLLRLKLGSRFRALQPGFEVHFRRDFEHGKTTNFAPYCLVGRNGTGKSNVLEVLAAIFYHIECIYLRDKPDGFDGEGDFHVGHTSGFFAELSDPDSFELEYLCHQQGAFASSFGASFEQGFDAHIRISKAVGEAPVIEWLDRKKVQPDGDLHLSALEVKDFLPEFVVGYSSGENEVLSLPFFKIRFLQYDEYLRDLKEQTGYSQPEARLIYVDSQFSQAVLLTNFLMHDEESLLPLYQTVGIRRITRFRIIVGYERKVFDATDDFDELGSINDENSANADGWRLVDLLEDKTSSSTTFKTLDRLRRCSTCCWHDTESGNLILDYFVDESPHKSSEMKKAFRAHFNNDPFELFRAFQTLLTLNLYDVDTKVKSQLYHSSSLYVKETVPISASDARVMRFKDFYLQKEFADEEILMKGLSDGEHQFLHTIGLCLLFRKSNSLFLLDEPDTHFNPEWRAKLLSTLNRCFDTTNFGHARDVLVTSHSPFVISDSLQENVLIFKSIPDRQVTVSRPDFNTFGASVNQITMKVFERSNTIGNYANEALALLYDKLENGEDKDALIDMAFRMLGDSVERIIFVNRAMGK